MATRPVDSSSSADTADACRTLATYVLAMENKKQKLASSRRTLVPEQEPDSINNITI
jgi:hypothetical protein